MRDQPVAAAVIPTAIAGLIGVTVSLSTLRSQTLSHLQQEVTARSAGVQLFFDQVAAELRFLADMSSVGALFGTLESQDAQRQAQLAASIEQDFVRLSELHPHVYQMRLLDASGQERVRVDKPQQWVPDISSGRTFCDWLRRERGMDTDGLYVYDHDCQDGRIVEAKLYRDHLLADFQRWFREIWLPEYGVNYFTKKDPASLGYLKRIPALAPPEEACNARPPRRPTRRPLAKPKRYRAEDGAASSRSIDDDPARLGDKFRDKMGERWVYFGARSSRLPLSDTRRVTLCSPSV